MAGLFDTLTLGSRSLSTYRKAIDTTGHNIANVNTPGYTRQRVAIESVTTSSDLGEVGAGSEVTRVVQLKNEFYDKQIQVETSVEGSLEARHNTLQQALNALQETIDRNGDQGTSTSGISQSLAEFFAGMQSLSTSPASIPERQVLLQKAQMLATRFNQIDARFGSVQNNVDQLVAHEVDQVNTLSREIANLNGAIATEEAVSDSTANDLRDSRQLKIEELSRLIKVESSEQPNGAVNIVVSGMTLVEGIELPNTLETFNSEDGSLQVRVSGQPAPLELTGGSIHGAISTRDNDISNVRAQVNALAENLINEVNRIHSAGFSLSGTTGANFFSGSSAADIAVNPELLGNPSLLQASSAPDESGNNEVALALAQLGQAAQDALNGQSFSDRQAQIVAALGQELANTRTSLEDQQAISGFVKGQRESISGVSLDEEMANLVMFQKAFQASAKLISMTDEMLATIIAM